MTMLRLRSPMEGLAKSRLTAVQVFAQAVSAVAPSAVMVTLPVVLLPTAGRWTPLVFAGVALVMVGVGVCINQFARRMVTVSGLYSYAVQGIGARLGFLTGTSVSVGYAAAAMASILGAGSYLRAVVNDLGGPDSATVTVAGCVLVGIATGTLMVLGVRISATATLIVEAVAITLALTVLVVVTLTDVTLSVVTEGIAPGSWGLILLLAVTSYVGFESATTVAREARAPFIAVPRAVLWTPVVTGSLLAVAALLVSSRGALSDDSLDQVGLSLTHDGLGVGGLELAMHLGILASWAACVIGSTTALSRTVFTMAREGVLPATLGRTHPRHHTPHHALAVLVPVITAVPTIGLLLGRSSSDLLIDLLALSAHGYVGAYVAVTIATPFFLHRIGELTSPVTVLAVAVGSTLVAIAVWGSLADFDRFVWASAGYLVALVAALAVLVLRRRQVPHLLHSLGMYDEPTAADVLSTGPLR